MGFPISAGLLDSMVLSVVDREDTYGYEITQFIRSAVHIVSCTETASKKRAT
jgi:PadR family transcriptional regulator PadR